MAPRCHACGESVHPDEDSCPVCGVLLQHTVLQAEITTADGVEPASDEMARLVFAPGQRFADRYTIIERLGEGGMGVVYKAIDTTLDGVITLKLIQPALGRNPGFVARFKREASITRRISHPNICRVHDIGESSGVLYISMEWIEGETVQQLLRQAGMLPESRALEFASRIADALDAAHAQGIVHRDLKPANVMVDRGGVVHVLDFGLALDAEGAQLTGVGAVVGTPLYMSPEQRSGQRVDARSDLYSLGLVLIEMLAGRRVVPDPKLTDNLPSEINPKLLDLLRRLLAWRPGDRFDSAAAAREEIDRLRADPTLSGFSTAVAPVAPRPARRRVVALLAPLLVAILAALAFGIWWSGRDDVGLNADARDFHQRGLDRLKNDYHTVEGLEAAIRQFARANDMQADSPVILSRLGLAYWYLYTKTHEPGWRDQAERYLGQASAIDPDSPELLHARGYGMLPEGRFRSARQLLERAVAARPDLPMAWADLAHACWELGDYGAASNALDESTRRDQGSYRTTIYRGLYHQHLEEYEQALAAYRRATELNPEASIGWNNIGAVLMQLGRFAEAIDPLVESLRLEEDAGTCTNVGTSHYLLDQFEEAERYYRRATELDSADPKLWGNLADALWKQERFDEASEVYGRAAEAARARLLADARTPDAVMRTAVFYALSGDANNARAHAEEALERQPDNAQLLVMSARVHAALGEDGAALDALLRAAERGAGRTQIEGYPDLARLAGDPKYARALELAR